MARLLRSLAVVALVACVAMAVFSLASLIAPGAERLQDRPGLIDVVIFSAVFLMYPVVGLIVAWHRPDHPVGWLFLVIGLSILVSVFATEYAGRAVFAATDLPAAQLVAWTGGWAWLVLAGIALPLTIILFPDGRLPGPRWRPFVWLGMAAVGLSILAAMVDPRPIEGYDDRLANPFRIGGAIGDAAIGVAGFGTVVILSSSILAVAAMSVRLRRSNGVERQQLKLVLHPAAIFVGGFIGASLVEIPIFWTLSLLGLASVAIGVGIAILRHRLFDIDLVIRRTLVYGALVAVLGAVYVALVLALQNVLSGLTGGDTLPVALSTLVIAALFGPVRARVRAIVDRRFYRSRYDAQRTVEQLVGRLRDEVELDAVGRTLVDVANRAVRPASASVWLRGGSSR